MYGKLFLDGISMQVESLVETFAHEMTETSKETKRRFGGARYGRAGGGGGGGGILGQQKDLLEQLQAGVGDAVGGEWAGGLGGGEEEKRSLCWRRQPVARKSLSRSCASSAA